MTDDVSKLPEWPEAPFTNTLDSDYELAWSMFYRRNADAYRARMEALVEYAEHAFDCYKWEPYGDGGRMLDRQARCTCGFDALLAACERNGGEG